MENNLITSSQIDVNYKFSDFNSYIAIYSYVLQHTLIANLKRLKPAAPYSSYLQRWQWTARDYHRNMTLVNTGLITTMINFM